MSMKVISREIQAGYLVRDAIEALRAGGKAQAFRTFLQLDPRNAIDQAAVRVQWNLHSVTTEEFAQWELGYETLTPEARRAPW